MSGKRCNNNKVRLALLLTIAVALTVLGSMILYLYDNKYTVDVPDAWQGVLQLSDETIADYPVIFLVEGWEFYGGRLLTPSDFVESPPTPDAYIYIGQYGGFEAGDYSNSPHGSASYRMLIKLPVEPRVYTLELPEIFSAFRLYLNGTEAAVMGTPERESYRAETRNRAISVEAGGELEILIAASDFSHLYSGMVYPPAFGEQEPVAQLLSARQAFRMLLIIFAVAVGLLAVMVGLLSGRNRLAVYYGLLCLFFVGYTAYPVWLTFWSGGVFFYTIERISFCAMLVVVMLLQRALYGVRAMWSRWFIGFAAFMCLFSLVLPLLLPSGSLFIMGAYSYLISIFELLAAAFLTASAIRALLRSDVSSGALLCGFAVLDTALVMDRVLPLFEPMVTGWFIELAGFALVLCVGAAVGRELAVGYREGAVLRERRSSMERLAEMQRANHELLMKQTEETKAIRHDLRHHFLMIEGLLENGEYDRLGAYVQEMRPSIHDKEPLSLVQNVVVDVLVRYYERMARKDGVEFNARIEVGQELAISDANLCAVLSNLLENAIEACGRKVEGSRFISLGMTQTGNSLLIRMENSADGALKKHGAGFLSSKDYGRIGYGLNSVAAIAKSCGGEAGFSWDDNAGIFESTVLLKLSE